MSKKIASKSFDSYFEALREMEKLEKAGYEPSFREIRNPRYSTFRYTVSVTI